MRREWRLFLTALQFLTRLPVEIADWAPDQLVRSMRYFPLAGLVIGLVSAFVWLSASALLPAGPAAGLALAAGVLLTGGLHEDGLADTADALGGNAGRERVLEIMRDSRIGSYGTLALILALGLKWTSLTTLSPLAGAAALIAAPVIGRLLLVPVPRLAPYAREEGAGQAMRDGPSPAEIAIATGIGLGILSTLVVWQMALLPGLAAGLVAAAIAGVLLLRLSIRRTGGYTGDVLGAIALCAETAILVAMAGRAGAAP